MDAAILKLLQQVVERLGALAAAVAALVEQKAAKKWYTPAEAAAMLGKAEFTVCEWCRLGRVRAEKRACGRGLPREWVISHAELQRVRNEGLLPRPEH